MVVNTFYLSLILDISRFFKHCIVKLTLIPDNLAAFKIEDKDLLTALDLIILSLKVCFIPMHNWHCSGEVISSTITKLMQISN